MLSLSSHPATPQSARISQKGAFTYILVSGFLHVVFSFLWLLPRDTPRSSDSKNMASGPIISWQIEGEKVEAGTDIIFLGSKITADSDCRCEMKRYLLLGRKAMTKLDRVLRSRDITLPAKVCMVKAMVFPVVKYRCDSWTINKAE